MSAHVDVTVDLTDYTEPSTNEEISIYFDSGDPKRVSPDDADRMADEIRAGAATYRHANRIAGASPTSDPRELLEQLWDRGILSPGLEPDGTLNILAALEKMEADGWRFVPPPHSGEASS